MQTITVSQLKMSLSAYLRQVKAGEEVIITEHGRPIARLLPLVSPVPLPEQLERPRRKGPPQAWGEALTRGFLGPAASCRPSSYCAFSGLAGAGGKPVKFWDTSAVVPLCVQEPNSAMVREIPIEFM